MGETGKSFGADVRAAEETASFETRGFAALLRMRVPFFSKRGAASPVPLFNAGALSSLYSIGAGGKSDVSLGFLLRQSAAAIGRGRALLAERAQALSLAILEKSGAETALYAQGARVAIALFWLFLAVILTREAATANGALFVRGLDPQSAAGLARVFIALSALGFVAAFVGGFLVRARSGEAGVRREAAALGADAGRIAHDFGESLDTLRQRMDAHGEHPGGAIEDLSRMHLVAIEATAFFEEIQFLADPDAGDAASKFRGFLRRHAPAGGPSSPAYPPLLVGAALGLVFGFALWAGPASTLAPAGGLPLWAIAATLGLAFLYAVMGRLFFGLAGPAAASLVEGARAEALAATRAAFLAEDAPRLDDLIRRTEDALAVFGARIDAGRSAAELAADTGEPHWRRPPEGPRFVSQAFQSAPPVFRPDAQAPAEKIFSAPGRRNAAPKQTASAPDALPWLKD